MAGLRIEGQELETASDTEKIISVNTLFTYITLAIDTDELAQLENNIKSGTWVSGLGVPLYLTMFPESTSMVQVQRRLLS